MFQNYHFNEINARKAFSLFIEQAIKKGKADKRVKIEQKIELRNNKKEIDLNKKKLSVWNARKKIAETAAKLV